MNDNEGCGCSRVGDPKRYHLVRWIQCRKRQLDSVLRWPLFSGRQRCYELPPLTRHTSEASASRATCVRAGESLTGDSKFGRNETNAKIFVPPSNRDRSGEECGWPS